MSLEARVTVDNNTINITSSSRCNLIALEMTKGLNCASPVRSRPFFSFF